MNSIVAPNVKSIISSKCLKQCAIAEKAGYTSQQFSAMVNGRRVIRDIDVLNIAKALEVDVNALFARSKEGDEKIEKE